jgi:hypothetical protein
MQFRPPPPPQVRGVSPARQSPRSDRDCPLHTARDRCLWHAGGTVGENEDARTRRRRLLARQRVRPVLGDHHLVGKSPEGSRQSCGETRTPRQPSPRSEVRGAVGAATCGSDERSITAPGRCCPPFASRLRTQRGPGGCPVPSGRGRLRRSGPPRPEAGAAGRAR